MPENQRYTYVFDGNSQAPDHILVSQHLTSGVGSSTTARPAGTASATSYDIVHINSEFLDRVRESDHEPEVALVTSNSPTAVTIAALSAQVESATLPWFWLAGGTVISGIAVYDAARRVRRRRDRVSTR
jgi:hypothetical protein